MVDYHANFQARSLVALQLLIFCCGSRWYELISLLRTSLDVIERAIMDYMLQHCLYWAINNVTAGLPTYYYCRAVNIIYCPV